MLLPLKPVLQSRQSALQIQIRSRQNALRCKGTPTLVKDGERFSVNYAKRGNPQSDSKRMRVRVYQLFEFLKLSEEVTPSQIGFELGATVPLGSYSPLWKTFFESCELRDFLDVITLMARAAAKRFSDGRGLVDKIAAIFEQENVSYRIDAKGGVHYAIDEEFAHNQASTISVLSSSRFEAARAHLATAQGALDRVPPDTRDAIRQAFECVETIFKLMFPSASVLGASEATKKLGPILARKFEDSELAASRRLLEAFKEWINSAQPYRHGQATESPVLPSITTAVLSVSMAASWARWLASLEETA